MTFREIDHCLGHLFPGLGGKSKKHNASPGSPVRIDQLPEVLVLRQQDPILLLGEAHHNLVIRPRT